MFLHEVHFLWERLAEEQEFRRSYPFHLPAYQGIESIRFEKPVTFFVGENGSGKSTLIEAMAALCEFPSSGGERQADEHSQVQEFPLQRILRLSWMPKINNGFFLRSETYFNFASLLDQRRRDPDFVGDPYSRYGGKSLHEQSHGESFITLFQSRFQEKRKAIYLLDEPEAALSPMRQLAFLRLMKGLTDSGRAQFIICTHSPILLGFPDAQIYTFDAAPLQPILYEETEHYAVTKYFLNQRERVLGDLFQEDDHTG